MDKGKYGRKDRLIKQKRHDTYQENMKLPEPAQCTDCGAVFSQGHWTWKESPAGAHQTQCPACRRIADQYPAGYVTLKGPFIALHREEIFNLIHNTEALEKSERPLERIMSIEERDGQTLIKTTGVHIARRIGEALARSYHGEYDFQYAEGEKIIRVNWER